MFTGIVQTIGTVHQIRKTGAEKELTLTVPWFVTRGLKRGTSVAVSGVCLTVVKKGFKKIVFDLSQETVEKTTLGKLSVGDHVNVERSARVGDEMGGHPISGHVYGVGAIIAVDPETKKYTVRVDPAWMQHIHQKGFIAIDGCSLTVVDPDKEAGTFSVAFIPETLRATTFGEKGAGSVVNVELQIGS